jgi:ElaB/YqjD/DUF883 family membrane-anchored ribosome-binding protein
MSRIGDEANVGDAVQDKAQKATQNLRDLGNQVRDAATDKYNQFSEQAKDYYSQGKDAAQEFEQSLESYVQEKPIQALLIAAGVGLLLGVLWKRS